MPIILESSAAITTSTTAQDIIRRAYRILGDIGTGEALTSTQKEEGLEGLNTMLDLFSIDRLLIYEVQQESFTWPANTTSRTIGTGGDFVTTRPDIIEQGSYFVDTNNITYAPEITHTRATYDRIVDKTVTSSYPDLLFYDPAPTLGVLYVYPVPDQALTFKLNSWKQLQQFINLTDVHIMPPGYKQLLIYNLALHLEAQVGLIMPQSAKDIAKLTKADIMRHNNPTIYSSTETQFVMRGHGRSDIVAGT